MVPPIDVSDINSVADAKKAIETGEISKERAEYIAKALVAMKKDTPAELDNNERKNLMKEFHSLSAIDFNKKYPSAEKQDEFIRKVFSLLSKWDAVQPLIQLRGFIINYSKHKSELIKKSDILSVINEKINENILKFNRKFDDMFISLLDMPIQDMTDEEFANTKNLINDMLKNEVLGQDAASLETSSRSAMGKAIHIPWGLFKDILVKDKSLGNQRPFINIKYQAIENPWDASYTIVL